MEYRIYTRYADWLRVVVYHTFYAPDFYTGRFGFCGAL